MNNQGLLVCGLLAPDSSLLATAEAALWAEFGPVTLRSAVIPFDFTDYYTPELGPGLQRCWIAQGRVAPWRLAEFKLAAGRIEQRLGVAGRRRVNIDPGVLTLHSLVLASTKNFAHRIALAEGVYAELTLIWRNRDFRPLEWTYPDYRSETCLEFLRGCRAALTGRGGQG